MRKKNSKEPKIYPTRTADVPVTQAMLFGVRDELLSTMNSRFGEVESRHLSFQARFDTIDSRFSDIDSQFKSIDSRFAQVNARFAQVDARFARVDSRFDKVDASIHRLTVLVEEQNARNNIVLEGLSVFLSRQERLEQEFSDLRTYISRPRQTE